MMKYVLLQAPGETLEGLSELEQLGYTVMSYPTSQQEGELLDTRCDEFTDFLGFHAEACDKPYLRSLRISFASMLRDDQAKILFFSSEKITVKWDAWGEESFFIMWMGITNFNRFRKDENIFELK